MPFRPILKVLPAVFAVLLGFIACKYAAKKDQPSLSIKDKPTAEMPIPPLPPAPGDYAEDWKIVDSLEKQGLFKSALERVETIQVKAKNDKNSPQVVKCLLYRGKYAVSLEEDGLVKAIQLFEAEEKSANIPTRAVLKSILGQLYATYLGNKGWQLRQRTPVPDGEGGDILTWSAAQIEKHAQSLYFASVERKAILLETPVGFFDDILTPGLNDTVGGQPLRPNLYDLLAHRALTYFANESNWLTEPAYAFMPDQAALFAPLPDFLKADFSTRDSTSNKWLAIKTFQRLLLRPQQIISTPGKPDEVRQNTAALVSDDLLRLEFARNNSVREDKDSLYRLALENLHRQYAQHPVDAEVVYNLASFLYQLDGGEKAANTKKAVALCEDAISRFPGTYGAGLCNLLLTNIRGRSLNIELESTWLPEKAMPVLVQYRNLGRVHVRVVKGNFDPDFLDAVTWDKRLEVVKSLPRVQQRSWDLNDKGDYQQHGAEIAVDALPLGTYYLLVAETEDFDEKKGRVAFAPFVVSNLAAVPMREKGQLNIAIVQRNTGAPLEGVKIEAFAPKHQRKNAGDVIGTMTTDRNGLARADWGERANPVLRATLGGDSLWLGHFYHYFHYPNDDQSARVHFFTDRALYRPGQTVYFKGILFRNDKEGKPQIIANQSVTAILYDVNEQRKGELELRANAWGTFNGAFAAPANGLTGQMRIELEKHEGAVYFNVEEYKRPKFEVAFKPLKDAFRLGAPVAVQGEAKAYAGSNIDGAQVRYRVVRQARFPFWDWGWGRGRKIFPWRTDQMEVANGVTTTDADGKFEVKFTAIPDPAIPRKENPQFDYTVYADVTDISGETRSAEQSVSAGYVALRVSWGLPKEVELDSLRRISIATTNLANQPQPTEGRVTLQRLVAPEQFFIERYWDFPDMPVIRKDEWKRLFPDYAWEDEDDPAKWRREDYLIPFAFNTATDKTVDLNGGNVQAGYYLAKLYTQDAYGEKIEIEKIVRVWDKNRRATQFESPAALADKSPLEPGETARIWLGGKPAGLNIFYARQKNEALDGIRWLSVEGAASVDIPVTENDRGGIVAYWFTVKNNRFYGGAPISIFVPWSNKELNVSYESFRDKLAPGQKEEWRIRISGPKKEKVAAEMVAALYDASLDQFLPHAWSKIEFPVVYPEIGFDQRLTFASRNGELRYDRQERTDVPNRAYPELNWFGFPLWGRVMRMAAEGDYEHNMVLSAAPAPAGGAPKRKEGAFMHDLNPDARYNDAEAATMDLNPFRGNLYAMPGGGQAKPQPAPPVQIRSNLNETVFFFPELQTDKDGNVVLKFTMNEALTRWKLLTYAHDKELRQALSVKEVVTQKELMVQANPPRFLRAGDALEFSAKVSNLSQETVSGTATLSLSDANTLQSLDKTFGLGNAGPAAFAFTVLPGRSVPLAWKIRVPDDFAGAVTWQVVADGKKYRDGEESTLPVVTNRMLVTETLPITVRGGQTKNFVFENLKNSGGSSSLKTNNYTLEFTSNPAWYAVQSLPYLMEFPHDCSEQIFSRFYANTLASSVTEKMPNIRKVYDRWKGGDAMKSNLSKNQELKYALLEETPWVLDAQDEEQQKRNIALLFDLNRMADERERAIRTLADRQTENGGWAWFPGGQDSWYITQHIVGGFGHLKHLGAFDAEKDPQAAAMLERAIGYCDTKMAEHYRELEALVQQGKAKWDDDHLDGTIIHYLYARSFFPQQIDKPGREISYYLGQAEKYWLNKGLYQEGMIALALHRNGRTEAAGRIVASLRERALVKEELGMYWPVDWGFYWYQLPVETQALMVEVFGEAGNDKKAVEELRIWLLKNKQTNRWESTKATAEAVYALLLFGDNWLQNTRPVQVSLGGKTLKPAEYEAGTGYFKQQWSGREVKDSWSDIKVENPNTNIVWGAAYWQYFEDLDKIAGFQKTPLTIVKQLFTEENSPTGPVLKPVAEGQSLKRGDRIKVRIEIRVDRAMEFVHLKDMRAAGFEPVNVLSGYRWQDGLGYYESTRDLATHFFIDYLPRGTFVFEYLLVVSHKGDMSNGVTTMQCMYAPEFTSHSKGVRVKVE